MLKTARDGLHLPGIIDTRKLFSSIYAGINIQIYGNHKCQLSFLNQKWSFHPPHTVEKRTADHFENELLSSKWGLPKLV